MRLFPSILLCLALPLAAADTYRIDAVHSEVGFRIRHLVSKVPGRFARFTGTIRLDEGRLAASSVEASIEAGSISTDSEARDKHLRSADFFDVAKFPAITFKSTAVTEVAKGSFTVTGDLCMHGVTRHITIPVTSLGAAVMPTDKSVHAGFEGSVKLNRNDFGIKAYPGLLGDDVEVTLNIEAIKAEK